MPTRTQELPYQKAERLQAQHLKELQETYPTVFGRLRRLEIEPGWMPILHTLGKQIKSELVKRDAKYQKGFCIGSVKEKWARLVVHYYEGTELGMDPEIDILISYASEKAESTCETCGKKGAVVADKYEWWRVKCLKHRAPDEHGLGEE